MRVLGLAIAAACVLLGASPALATPSPSPSLDGLLAPPPSSGYVRNSSLFPPVEGSFDAVDYLSGLNSRKPSETFATLKEDGFVQGFGRAWIDRAAGRLLLELVIAFQGGAGAKKWVPEAGALAKDSQYFTRDVAVTGIDVQYGAHFANPSGPAYVDEIGFVKGNDFFLVQMYSEKDDLGDTAVKQARQQYDAAPASTIPTASWPENASNAGARGISAPSFPATVVIIAVVAGIVLLAVILLGVLLITRARRRAVTTTAAPSDGLQMSPDGSYWWDGQTWREAAREVPPSAMRSADGAYWWDGQKWREVRATS